jgi:peptide chain release factor 2
VILFDPISLNQDILSLEHQVNAEGFWLDQRRAKVVIQQLNEKKETLENRESIIKQYESLLEIYTLLQEDESIYEDFRVELDHLHGHIKKVRQQLFFSGEFDGLNAIVSIHPGAGGTESHDWADMLYRMYTRYAEANKMSITMMDFHPGEEAGIKSVTLLIKGVYAYGKLKSEKGIHRLVRISPFDANGRRHTSFASVNVIPEIIEDIDLEIPDKELRIDTYRSGGAGGQNVNKVETAVRITHIPTGLVASCQIERSQLQNKALAMQMLKAQLYQRKKQEQKEAMDTIVGEQKNIEWGSQIRSYVFQPYTMVKDHRTNYQTGDVADVMDGGLDGFIESFLEFEAKKK